MAVLRGIFVIAEVGGALGETIHAVQREHDPRLARLWKPHITLIGSSGTGPIVADASVTELRDALEPVATRTAPLTLTFGAPMRFVGRDIVVLPLDPHGPLRTLHEALRATGVRTHVARFPFTPHCTLTMYPALAREREARLLALRVSEPFVMDRLRVLRTREPYPAEPLLELPLLGAR